MKKEELVSMRDFFDVPKIIKFLLARGYTKKSISSYTGASYMTVFHWSKKTFKPQGIFLTKLLELYENESKKLEA